MASKPVLAGAIAGLFVLAPFATPATADHRQEGVVFHHVGGNEWWVEVVVDHGGNRPDEVYARDDGDSVWHPLEFKSWDEWGGSFHIEPGHRVMFRSVDHDLGTVESCWFFHPSGAENCSQEPEPGDFDASFRTPGGNEWWVEVYVTANEPIAGVEARVDDGAWKTLTKRSWGAWAASFHVPDGSLVDFRAHSTDGDVDVSGKYRWPDGTPFDQPTPLPPLNLAFAPKASNEWWVETLVVGNGGIVGVEARVGGGAWHQLTLRSWGAWAASFHVPTGSTVEFRGTSSEGRTGVSDGFLWPDAVPASDPNGAWPQEGSYARYKVSWGVAGDTQGEAFQTFVRHDDRWMMECVGTNRGFYILDFFGPPQGPTETNVGNDETVGTLDECEPTSHIVDVLGHDTFDTHHEGDGVTVQTWSGFRATDFDYKEVEWETVTGYTVRFWDGGTDWAGGHLEDTDAPVGTV